MRALAPLVRPGIFRLRTLTVGNLVSQLCAGAFVSLLFVLTLSMQQVLGYAAISTGLAFLPLALMIMHVSNLVSRIVARVGVKLLRGIFSVRRRDGDQYSRQPPRSSGATRSSGEKALRFR